MQILNDYLPFIEEGLRLKQGKILDEIHATLSHEVSMEERIQRTKQLAEELQFCDDIIGELHANT